MALVLPMPTADVAAIQPNHDGVSWLRCGQLCRLGGVRLHNGLADPQRPVPHRAGVPRPADRKQLRQQRCDLAERRQRRKPGRDIRQFGRHSRRLKVEDSEALCISQTLAAGTDKQAPNSDRHVTEQGAKRRRIITLAGQHASTRRAQPMTLAHHGYLPRHHLCLERRCDLLCLCQPQSKVGHAGLFIAFDAADLHLSRHPSLQLRHQLHPPHQLRHQLTFSP